MPMYPNIGMFPVMLKLKWLGHCFCAQTESDVWWLSPHSRGFAWRIHENVSIRTCFACLYHNKKTLVWRQASEKSACFLLSFFRDD